jgi:hypothetical protein
VVRASARYATSDMYIWSVTYQSTRFDTKYDVDGTPSITAKLGWIDLNLLEGTTTGRMSGKEYINQTQPARCLYGR